MTIIKECANCRMEIREESEEKSFSLILCNRCRNSSDKEFVRRGEMNEIAGSKICNEWFRTHKRHFWSGWF